MKNLLLISLLIISSAISGCAQNNQQKNKEGIMEFEVQKSSEEWKEELSTEEYRILREKGTERAFNNEYWDNKREGVYHCAACERALFNSDTKFKSGSGWPSFFKPISENSIVTKMDRTAGMVRTEVLCSRCGGHLGHVFEDGPQPTGLRYCLNSAALDFEPQEQ